MIAPPVSYIMAIRNRIHIWDTEKDFSKLAHQNWSSSRSRIFPRNQDIFMTGTLKNWQEYFELFPWLTAIVLSWNFGKKMCSFSVIQVHEDK